jgi:biopolymer transport protein ExbD
MPLKLQQHDEIQLNLTPMIDVLFLLIIFFMVAARFGDMQRSVDLQLPKVTQGGASNAPPEPLEVQVRSDGQVELQTKIVSLPVLIDTLRSKMAASTETEVLISGDARCDFQHVAATLGRHTRFDTLALSAGANDFSWTDSGSMAPPVPT